MARARRRDIFEPEEIGVYHCYNRIVRRSFLCGFDSYSGHDYSHRRQWLYQRLKDLAEFFAVDVLAYAILSNHYHLVLRNRPDQVEAMSDDQVITAWLMICPQSPKRSDGSVDPPTEAEIRAQREKPGRVKELRRRLSDLSWFMRLLDQYMGIRCNAEDKITGHFWEARFGMTRLLDEAAVLACMAYVDLNPIRAGAAESLEGYQHVSIGERLRTLEDEQVDSSDWLAPLGLDGQSGGERGTVVNGLARQELEELLAAQKQQPLGCLPMTLEDYQQLLNWLACKPSHRAGADQDAGRHSILKRLELDPGQFADVVSHFTERFFTSAGCPASLDAEAKRRGRGRLNGPGKRSLAPRVGS